MYSQLIYFLIALVLFTLQQPGSLPLTSPAKTFFSVLGLWLFFALICHLSLRHFGQRLWRVSQSNATRQYHRIQNRLTILALAFLAIDIYIFNLKFYLQIIPGFDQSLAVSGIIGIGIFLAHLILIWIYSYPAYKKIFYSEIPLSRFLKGNIAFISAILIPWFLISLVSDILQAIKLPTFLTSDLGEFVLLFALLTIFVLFAPWLVVRLWGCEPLPPSHIREELQDFCQRYNFVLGNFMLWPLFGNEMLTAGIIGILPRLRYILVTKGLLAVLNIDELKAVVAHEMGHVRRLHIFVYLLFFICYSILAYSFQDVIFLLLLKNQTFLQWAMAPDTLHLTLFSIIYTMPVLLLLVIYFRYVFGYFMRNSERQADLYALRLIGDPSPLITSLQKIAYHSGHIEDLPSWHHFSIRERIHYLLKSHKNPSLIRQHDRKMYGSILFFLVVVIGLSFTGFQLQNMSTVQRWKVQVQAQMLEKQIQTEARNPAIYGAYGGLLLELGRYDAARSFLRKALQMAPHDATIMNNLAWLYATSPPPFLDPENALKLARQAASLEFQPYILDTLAEAYYVNGRYQDALQTLQQALAMKPENQDYFLKQLNKFERAASQSKGLAQ